MKRESAPMLWMSSAFGAALALATAVLVINGTGVKSVIMALQVTARWSFALFWLAYAGESLATLFGGPFQRLAGRGREFGLSYAAAHLIHLGLVGWLILVMSRSPLSRDSTIFFSVAIFWTYLLAIFSFGAFVQGSGFGHVVRGANDRTQLHPFRFCSRLRDRNI